ncbi:MAG: response regulator [Candidatus Terrybacteria bacterium]|nr:response regulator [Candidatus Terrybacteria bacterium]
MATILVADDEKNIADLIAEALRNDGHQVIVAYDGKQAMEKLESRGADSFQPRADLIILDVRMPHMDGYTIFTLLQQDELTRSIPTIVLTSKRDMEDLFDVSQARIAYLRKPFDLQVLRERIRELLGSNGGDAP